MPTAVLKQGDILITSIQGELTDRDFSQLRDELIDKIGRDHAAGVLIDLSMLDILDSFGTRMLSGIVYATKLRGAKSIVVGIRPDVALSIVQLGLRFEDIPVAIDLEEGFALLADAREDRNDL